MHIKNVVSDCVESLSEGGGQEMQMIQEVCSAQGARKDCWPATVKVHG